MLEIVPTRCRQGLLERRRPLLVGLGQSPHLVRGQAQVSEHSPKGLAAVDDLQELPAFSTGSRACALRRPRALASALGIGGI
jgi:hypothetical protein